MARRPSKRSKRPRVREADVLLGDPEGRQSNPTVAAWVAEVVKELQSMDAHWGADRLPLLVSAETRARWWRHWESWCRLVHLEKADEVDLEQVAALSRGCVRGLRSMDEEARVAGALSMRQLSIDRLEHVMDDGSVLVVVRDMAEAKWLEDDGRRCVVWSMRELENVLPLLAEVGQVKEVFPGAEVERVGGDQELDDDIPF